MLPFGDMGVQIKKYLHEFGCNKLLQIILHMLYGVQILTLEERITFCHYNYVHKRKLSLTIGRATCYYLKKTFLTCDTLILSSQYCEPMVPKQGRSSPVDTVHRLSNVSLVLSAYIVDMMNAEMNVTICEKLYMI